MNSKIIRGKIGAMAAVILSASLLAGCSPAASTAGSKDTTGSLSGGFAEAQKVSDELLSNPSLQIDPLPKAVEKGVSVAVVNCTLPSCLPGAATEPAAALGWKVQDFPFDLAKGPADFVASVERAIAAQPQVLVLTVVYPETLIQAQIDAAAKAGIKVIDIGGQLSPGYAACIQCQPAAAAQGVALANVALADAGAKTSVGIVIDKTLTTMVNMGQSAAATIKEKGEGSKAEMLELNVADNPAANAARTVSFLQRHPDVKYLLYTTPSLLLGAGSALKAAGLEVKTISVNPSNAGEVTLVQTGDVYKWVGGESSDGAFVWRAFDAAARAVQNAPIDPKEPVTSMRLITKDNAAPALGAPTDFKSIYTKAWGTNQK